MTSIPCRVCPRHCGRRLTRSEGENHDAWGTDQFQVQKPINGRQQSIRAVKLLDPPRSSKGHRNDRFNSLISSMAYRNLIKSIHRGLYWSIQLLTKLLTSARYKRLWKRQAMSAVGARRRSARQAAGRAEAAIDDSGAKLGAAALLEDSGSERQEHQPVAKRRRRTKQRATYLRTLHLPPQLTACLLVTSCGAVDLCRTSRRC